MKAIKPLILIIFAIIVLMRVESFGQTSDEGTTYEYAYVQKIDYRLFVFYGSGETEETKFEKSETYQIAILKKLEELSSRGWEVIESQVTATGNPQILLKRKK